MASLSTVSGSGGFKEATLIGFSYTEDVTPDNPADLNGGTGQVTAQVVADTTARGSRIAINNQVLLEDEELGSLEFEVKQSSINEDLVSLVGQTIQSRLDVEITAPPYGSPAGGYTLYSAIVDYCSFAGIVPNFEAGLADKLDLIDVDFTGWRGNLWEHLKMLCSACPIDADDNTLLEMYFKDGDLWFREGLKTALDTSNYVARESIAINSFDAAQSVRVFMYNNVYKSNYPVRQDGAQDAGFANIENVSITDSLQVNATEKITRRVRINASLESVNQPVPVFSITSVPYTGITGEYVIVGKDSLPLTPEQWLGQGGSLSVSITENPNEIEISIVGANYPELEPFRIGIESSGSENYPALYITGTGVFSEKTEHEILTGAPEFSEAQAPTIDNPFITDKNKLWTRGVAAAQSICGPSYTLSQDIMSGAEFGESLGSMVSAYDVKFRVNRLAFNQRNISLSGNKYVTFADFNAAWSGDTIGDFNTAMSGLSFNEFSIVPLSKES